jgi:tetratricopeptide (TPR) repeat protein
MNGDPSRADDAEERSLQAFRQGSAFLENGRLNEALAAFSEAIAARPDDVLSWEKYACTLVALERLEESLEAFAKLDQLGHQCKDCAEKRWDALCRLGRVEEAKAAAQRLLTLLEQKAQSQPEEADRHRGTIANLHMVMGERLGRLWNRPQEADEAFRQAVACAGQLVHNDRSETNEHRLALVLLASGLHHQSQKRVDAAEEALRRALRIWDRLQEAQRTWTFLFRIAGCLGQLGLLYHETGRLARAEWAFRQALAIREALVGADRSDVESAVHLGGTLCNLGNVYGDQWKFSDALASFDRSILALEVVLQGHADHARAKEFLSNAQDGRAATLAHIAAIRKPSWFRRRFSWLVGRGEKGIQRPEIHTDTVGWRPAGPLPQRIDYGVPWPAEATGSLEAFQAGRYGEALQSLDQFLAGHPGEASGWFWKARALGACCRYADALGSLDRLLALQPDHAAAQCDKSDILRFLKRDREALRVIDSLLKRDPQHVHAWHLKGLILGRFLDERGEGEVFDFARCDEAIEAFDQAILLEPDYFEARLYKGIALRHACHSTSARVNLLTNVAPRDLGEEAALLYLGPFLKAYEGYLDRARDMFVLSRRLLRPRVLLL